MYFYLLSLAIVIADQAFKYFIHNSMRLGQSIALINGVKLTYVRNTGAAFSLFAGFSPYLIVIGITVMLAVIYFHHRVAASQYILQTGLAFILGGSAGNLIDRIFRSYVIDYIDITIWPVFNFSDIMINAGVILVILKLFKKDKKDVPRPV